MIAPGNGEGDDVAQIKPKRTDEIGGADDARQNLEPEQDDRQGSVLGVPHHAAADADREPPAVAGREDQREVFDLSLLDHPAEPAVPEGLSAHQERAERPADQLLPG